MLLIARLLAPALCLIPLWAQSKQARPDCPITARLPADSNWMEDMAQRQRYELRQCPGNWILVTAFERKAATPSLTVELSDPSARSLFHSFNVLVLQTLGGSSDHVTVLTFESGKPKLALRTATKDLIQVQQEHDAVIVLVPPTTYPGPDGKFPPPPPVTRYRFPLDH